MKVLLADDEKTIRVTLADSLAEEGYEVTAVATGTEAWEQFERHEFDALIADVKMPGLDGLTLLSRVKQARPDFPVIVITAAASVESAVAAMRAGAATYIKKPFYNEEIVVHLKKVEEARAVREELTRLRTAVAGATDFDEMVGQSKAMRELFDQLDTVAPTDFGLLITGENGAGKELVARALHRRSARAAGPFVAVNCAALTETLIESELFGHVKGAFTGAVRDHPGRFQTASGGTLFLDEIGEMPLNLQVKLLRVLESQQVVPVGSDRPVDIDVRLVAATNRDLEQMIEAGTFREDLFYRLNVIHLAIPPLRTRPDDVPLLARFFLDRYSGGRRFELTDDLVIALMNHPWPGNVRELENAVKRAIALAGHATKLKREHLVPPASTRIKRAGAAPTSAALDLRRLKDVVQDVEIRHLKNVLRYTAGHKQKAADLLGISRKSLWEKMKEYQIEELG